MEIVENGPLLMDLFVQMFASLCSDIFIFVLPLIGEEFVTARVHWYITFFLNSSLFLQKPVSYSHKHQMLDHLFQRLVFVQKCEPLKRYVSSNSSFEIVSIKNN